MGDETPPGCEAYDEEENIWILMLGLDTLRNDGNVEGIRLLIDSRHARRSSAQEQPRDQLRCDTHQASTTRAKQQRQVADVRRPMTGDRDLTAMGCEVEFSMNGAHIPSGGRRWKLEQGRGQFFLTVGSLRDGSKTWLHDESAPLEVSVVFEARTEAANRTLCPASEARTERPHR